MGQRGPAPRPTSLKILRGQRPDQINFSEPQPLDVPVDKPDHLSDVAAAEWDRIAPHLVSMGTVKATDLAIVIAYCESYARYLVVKRLAQKTPPSFARKFRNRETGEIETTFVKNPIHGQVRDAEAGLVRLCRELGFTPSARSAIRVELLARDFGERLLTHG
jgi:P27 family predicted phage terminase small subunit